MDHCLLLNTTLLSFAVINQIMNYHTQGYFPLERRYLKPALNQNTEALTVGLQAAHGNGVFLKKIKELMDRDDFHLEQFLLESGIMKG